MWLLRLSRRCHRLAGWPPALAWCRCLMGRCHYPPCPPRRTSTVVYGLSAIDDRGRITDRVIVRALGWPAGLRLDICESDGILTVRAAPDGAYQVTAHGHLRLPAALRHRCSLAAGDRVLLAADPDRSRLAIYPPATLDTALAHQAPATVGGEPT